MTCDAPTLAQASRCLCGFSKADSDAIAIYLLCLWAEENSEHIAAPCQLTIVNGPGGTVVISWHNPMAYTSIEVFHVNIFSGNTHLETTLAGTAETWTTPVLTFGDFFVIRGVSGDDHSGFAYSGPCV